MAITLGVILYGIVLVLGLIEMYELGAFLFISFIVLAVGIYLATVLWFLKYIAKYGTLTIIGSNKQDEPATN